MDPVKSRVKLVFTEIKVCGWVAEKVETFYLPLAILRMRKLMSFSRSWNVGQSSYHTGKVRGYEVNKGCLKLFSIIKGQL